MTKVATVSKGILSRKGMAQPMAATAPLVRANTSAAIDWRGVANGPAPLNYPVASARRLRNRDGQGYRHTEPRIRISLRLDRHRHATFKAFCTLVRRTQQGVLEQALDEFFARQGLDEAAGDRRRPRPE